MFEKFTASYWRCKKFPARTYAHAISHRIVLRDTSANVTPIHAQTAECSLNDVYKRLHQPT